MEVTLLLRSLQLAVTLDKPQYERSGPNQWGFSLQLQQGVRSVSCRILLQLQAGVSTVSYCLIVSCVLPLLWSVYLLY